VTSLAPLVKTQEVQESSSVSVESGFSMSAWQNAWDQAVSPASVLGTVIDKMAEGLRQIPDPKAQWRRSL